MARPTSATGASFAVKVANGSPERLPTSMFWGLPVMVATLPMFLLSGVFFSAKNFPSWLQPAIDALPLTAFNDALRAIVNDGAGFAAIGADCAVLAAWAVAAFLVALRIFRWG